MRRGMISSPPFVPPGGMRFPGPPPMMPPMPVNMPKMPQQPPQPPQPQQQVTGEQPASQPAQEPAVWPQNPTQFPVAAMQTPAQFPAPVAQSQATMPFPLPSLPQVAQESPLQFAQEIQAMAPVQAPSASERQFPSDPSAQQALWMQQQAFAQQQRMAQLAMQQQQAIQQQQSLAAMMPYIMPQRQDSPGVTPVEPSAAGAEPATRGAELTPPLVKRTPRSGTYSTRERGDGYSVRG